VVPAPTITHSEQNSWSGGLLGRRNRARPRLPIARVLAVASIWVLAIAGLAEHSSLRRQVPRPLASHPGNIFLAGESVSIALPGAAAGSWRVIDYAGRGVASGTVANARATVGSLPTGYYEVRWGDESFTNRVSVGIVTPLRTPTPLSSPVGLDVAMAWFYPEPKMEAAASLCALAGVNWVRDRLSWPELEPARGSFAPPNRYDASTRVQAATGLQVLQVNHISPRWANTNSARFPLDLRDEFNFYREMARRWHGQVAAFEPWNEADIDMFGGHTGSEIASLQKAAYLGLKAGDPTVVACQNVFALHNRSILEDFRRNEVWPYFDTFNLHHYGATETYPEIYGDFRAASAGKPLWVTECNVPVHWSGDENLKEPSEADLRVQGERVARVFASSLHEGASAVYYFMLPHYAEGPTQFGVVRPDLTPRPAYLALAAVGRLLADARPLGRLHNGETSVRAFLFRAKPDGQAREVLVAWATNHQGMVSLPIRPIAVFDHLGRQGDSEQLLRLSQAPVFAVLPKGTAQRLPLLPPPEPAERLEGRPSSVVLQALWPQDKLLARRSAYRLAAKQWETIPLFAYNFGQEPVSGRFHVRTPASWQCRLAPKIELEPGERKELPLSIFCSGPLATNTHSVRIEGRFGRAGRAVLSLNLWPEPSPAPPVAVLPIAAAETSSRWTPSASGEGLVKITRSRQGVVIEGRPQTTNRYLYPRFDLRPEERLGDAINAVQVSLTLLEGSGQFRLILEEDNDSNYIVDFSPQPRRGETLELTARVEQATWGAWSMPDPDDELDLSRVKAIRIGCNTKDDKVKFALKNLRWLRF
jgi:hypothetical protein